MMNLAQLKESDPRLIATWPVSPNYEDAMLLQSGNSEKFASYGSATKDNKHRDINIQSDGPLQQEWLNALNRKQGELMSHLDETDELLKHRQLRKRGRKNKYQNLIDQEDDKDDMQAKEEEEYLKLLAEQLAEEEQLKLIVSQSLKIQKEINASKSAKSIGDLQSKFKEDQITQRALIQSFEENQFLETQRVKDEQIAQEQENIRLADLETIRAAELAGQVFAQEQLARKVAQQQEQSAQKFIKEQEANKEAELLLELQLEQENARRKALEKDRSIAVGCYEEQASNEIKLQQSSRSGQPVNFTIPDDASSQVVLNDNAFSKFNKQKRYLITIPPNPDLRTFNENDVLGDLDRDDKGNVIVEGGRYPHDKNRNPVNSRGYLIDPKSGDIIDSEQGKVMFPKCDIDERDELPAPFCIERYNFNPHNLMGDFDYSEGTPSIAFTSQGIWVDKQGRNVNQKGWYTKSHHIVDKDGRKMFDKSQLVNGDLPNLFNYQGVSYDIRDVMGEFEKDANGDIQLNLNGSQLADKLGRKVNEKGYLVDFSGNIIDQRGKQLFLKLDLKSGEFIKIFPFTKFNLLRILGDIAYDDNGQLKFEKQIMNQAILDRQGRTINARGYLIDRLGNVTDIKGNLVFQKNLLEKDGEIPLVFRTGILRSDSNSSISRLMSEIERNHIPQSDSDNGKLQSSGANDKTKKYDEISLDSRIIVDENNNYQGTDLNAKAIIFEDEEEEDCKAQSDYTDNENPTNLLLRKRKIQKKSRKQKKNNKNLTIEFLEPTDRQKIMAGAYGCEAIAEIRRPHVKYDQARLHNSKMFRLATAADEPRMRAQLTRLVPVERNTPSQGILPVSVIAETTKYFNRQHNQDDFLLKNTGLMIDTSNNSKKNKKISKKIKHKVQKTTNDDQDFDQTYGKDIQQFLDDSEWDIDSFNQISLSSKDNVSGDEDEFGLKADFKLSSIEQAYIRGANLKISKTVTRNSKGLVMRSMTNITGKKPVKIVGHHNIQQNSSAGIKIGSTQRQLVGLPTAEIITNDEPMVQTKTMIE